MEEQSQVSCSAPSTLKFPLQKLDLHFSKQIIQRNRSFKPTWESDRYVVSYNFQNNNLKMNHKSIHLLLNNYQKIHKKSISSEKLFIPKILKIKHQSHHITPQQSLRTPMQSLHFNQGNPSHKVTSQLFQDQIHIERNLKNRTQVNSRQRLNLKQIKNKATKNLKKGHRTFLQEQKDQENSPYRFLKLKLTKIDTSLKRDYRQFASSRTNFFRKKQKIKSTVNKNQQNIEDEKLLRFLIYTKQMRLKQQIMNDLMSHTGGTASKHKFISYFPQTDYELALKQYLNRCEQQEHFNNCFSERLQIKRSAEEMKQFQINMIKLKKYKIKRESCFIFTEWNRKQYQINISRDELINKIIKAKNCKDITGVLLDNIPQKMQAIDKKLRTKKILNEQQNNISILNFAPLKQRPKISIIQPLNKNSQTSSSKHLLNKLIQELKGAYFNQGTVQKGEQSDLNLQQAKNVDQNTKIETKEAMMSQKYKETLQNEIENKTYKKNLGIKLKDNVKNEQANRIKRSKMINKQQDKFNILIKNDKNKINPKSKHNYNKSNFSDQNKHTDKYRINNQTDDSHRLLHGVNKTKQRRKHGKHCTDYQLKQKQLEKKRSFQIKQTNLRLLEDFKKDDDADLESLYRLNRIQDKSIERIITKSNPQSGFNVSSQVIELKVQKFQQLSQEEWRILKVFWDIILYVDEKFLQKNIPERTDSNKILSINLFLFGRWKNFKILLNSTMFYQFQKLSVFYQLILAIEIAIIKIAPLYFKTSLQNVSIELLIKIITGQRVLLFRPKLKSQRQVIYHNSKAHYLLAINRIKNQVCRLEINSKNESGMVVYRLDALHQNKLTNFNNFIFSEIIMVNDIMSISTRRNESDGNQYWIHLQKELNCLQANMFELKVESTTRGTITVYHNYFNSKIKIRLDKRINFDSLKLIGEVNQKIKYDNIYFQFTIRGTYLISIEVEETGVYTLSYEGDTPASLRAIQYDQLFLSEN